MDGPYPKEWLEQHTLNQLPLVSQALGIAYNLNSSQTQPLVRRRSASLLKRGQGALGWGVALMVCGLMPGLCVCACGTGAERAPSGRDLVGQCDLLGRHFHRFAQLGPFPPPPTDWARLRQRHGGRRLRRLLPRSGALQQCVCRTCSPVRQREPVEQDVPEPVRHGSISRRSSTTRPCRDRRGTWLDLGLVFAPR